MRQSTSELLKKRTILKFCLRIMLLLQLEPIPLVLRIEPHLLVQIPVEDLSKDMFRIMIQNKFKEGT